MTTMTFTLPDSLSAFIDDEVASKGFESGGEYLRTLVRQEQARQGLREMLLAGAASGPGEPADAAYFQRQRDRVRAARTAAE